MAIQILITNKKVGKSWIYSQLNQQGRKKSVPTYRLLVLNESGNIAEFAVTRDGAADLFGSGSAGRYGLHGEVPPNKLSRPYRAHIREDGRRGFRLELYEKGIGAKGNHYALKGMGKVIRTNIQIHLGPGLSQGCFLLTGGRKKRNDFAKTIRSFIREDKRQGVKGAGEFVVRVQKR